jgi:4'-phosphopantetheinyl transferase
MSLLGLNNGEIEFGVNEHGKPFLQGHTSFHFNISHTWNAIAIAFSNDNVGVDIEKIKSPDFQISRRFFTSSEQGYILSHNNPGCAFYEIWTKKEAYAKYTGEGLTMSMALLNVLKAHIASKINTFQMKNYMISVCNEKPETNYNLIALFEKQIVEMIFNAL